MSDMERDVVLAVLATGGLLYALDVFVLDGRLRRAALSLDPRRAVGAEAAACASGCELDRRLSILERGSIAATAAARPMRSNEVKDGGEFYLVAGS